MVAEPVEEVLRRGAVLDVQGGPFCGCSQITQGIISRRVSPKALNIRRVLGDKPYPKSSVQYEKIKRLE